MLVYWLLLGYFAVGAMLIRPRPGRRPGAVMMALGSLIVALAIGLRFKVGADWETYGFLFPMPGSWTWIECSPSATPATSC